MSLSHERRKPPRESSVPFRFFPSATESFQVVAHDASIRSARFSLSDQERIANFESGEAVFFGSVGTLFEGMKVTQFEHAGGKVLLATYKTRQLRDNEVLRGHLADYKVLQFISAGQSAETYKAIVAKVAGKVKPRANGLARNEPVVIKVPLFVPNLSDADFNELIATLNNLFTNEVTGLKRLADLPCVAGLLDDGVHQFRRVNAPDTFFMVQKYVDGNSLDEYLRRNYSNREAIEFTGLPSENVYALGRSIADAVRQVHSEIVIHGDIWPENILVASGKPVLIDFGQAILREAAEPVVKVSGRNARYIAPEKTRSVGGDVYSLGGVLFYLSTGEDPPGSTQSINDLTGTVLERIRLRNERLYRETRGLADIIARCLCTSDERYPDVHTVIEHLDTFFKRGHNGVSVSQAIREILCDSERLDKDGDKLFRWMASLRVNALRADLKEMGRNVYDLVGDHTAIAAGLTQYLGLLGEGDEYLTISTPRFWRPGNPGSDGEFLSMNVMAAQRGAMFKRVFVIGPRDRSSKWFQEVMDTQVQTIRELEGTVPKGRYEVKILDVDRKGEADILQKRHHFGLLVKQGHQVAVYPDYRADGSIAAVRFRAGPHLVGSLRGTFEHYWHMQDAIDLMILPADQEIEQKARKLYEARGGEGGSALEDWLQAKRELIERNKGLDSQSSRDPAPSS